MNSKILPFYGIHYRRHKHPPLTSKMIITLLKACTRLHTGVYGPSDIKGSLTSLILRGLIVRKRVWVKGISTLQWQVTVRAIEVLRKLGDLSYWA